MQYLLSTIALLYLIRGISAQIPSQDWGYISINITHDSNMFWWLYGATENPEQQPLVMWLQGGPGGSSLYGDFLEIGPVDVFGKSRNTTWLSSANLLFVDNPIGTGFSYTTSNKGFSTTDEEIAENLVIFMEGFLAEYPIFEKTDFWVFSESYGGKMTANFGVALDKAIKSGRVNLQSFKGVALGDSWIAPIDCMYSYPPFMYSTSLIDANQAANLTYYAIQASHALNSENNGTKATDLWNQQQMIAEDFAGQVNFYNFMYYDDYLPEEQLTTLIDTTVRDKLGDIPANVTWGGQADDVFTYMSGDFMKSGVPAVDYLLKEGYQVAVYSGQLDIIVDVICIESWMRELTWPGIEQFLKAPRTIESLKGTPNGYRKVFQNLQMWGIYKAGHMVPADNGDMALFMFNTIINGN